MAGRGDVFATYCTLVGPFPRWALHDQEYRTVPPAPRPVPRPAPSERMATCLESDEEVMDALRAHLSPRLGKPLPPAVVLPGSPPKPTTPLGAEPAPAPPASP